MNTEKICNACGCVIEGEAVEINGLFYCADCDADEELWLECANCGERMYADSVEFETDEACFCSEECMTEAGYFSCDYCYEIHALESEETVEIDGERYCSEDCAISAGYEKCADCGEWVSDSDVIYIHGRYDDKYICSDCYYGGDYFCCDHCGGHFEPDALEIDDGDTSICWNCADDYTTCEDCGAIIRIDDSYDFMGYPHCEECYNSNHEDLDEGGDINEWNYKPCPMFYNETTSSYNYDSVGDDPYEGVELEVDKGDNPRALASELYDEFAEIYCKHDGSLSCGVEIVSHPCTLGYHTNKMRWKEIMQYALNRNFKSHDAGTCGLHVHVNRSFFGITKEEQDLHIAKVILIVNRFWDSHIVPFTRRNTGEINQWARKNETGKLYKDDSSNEKCRKTITNSNNMGRYVAVNLQNRNTIEFRIFRGTLKHETFLATLQFVDTLCRFVKTISIDDVDNLAWEDIFAGTDYPELNAYLAERTDFNPANVKRVFVEDKPVFSRHYTPIKNRADVAVGDRVIIRSWEDMCDEFEGGNASTYSIRTKYHFVSDMRRFCGKTAIVKSVDGYDMQLVFEDGTYGANYYWSNDMIDVIAKRDRNKARVGDRVIVRSWADIQAHCKIFPVLRAFTGLMKYMCEKTGEIQEINGDIIEITFDDPTCSQCGFIITTDMIELLD